MNYRQFAIFLGLLFALSVNSIADVNSEIRDLENQKTVLNNEIKKTSSKIKEAEKWSKEDANRYSILEKRYREDLARRSSEIDSLNAKIKKIAEQVQAEKNKQGMAKNRTDRVRSRRNASLSLMANYCKKLEQQVEETLPWDKEIRLERVRSLLRDIQTKNASEEEAFSRLKVLIQEETRFGDEVVIINAPLTRKNGEIINARILRIGNQWMVYSDENSTVYGVLKRSLENGKVKYDWYETLTLAERDAIKFAIDVKQARKAPQMVTLPLSLSIFREEGESK